MKIRLLISCAVFGCAWGSPCLSLCSPSVLPLSHWSPQRTGLKVKKRVTSISINSSIRERRKEAICVCEGEDTSSIQITAWSAQILQKGAPVRNVSEKKWIYKIALPNVPLSVSLSLSLIFLLALLFLLYLSCLVCREKRRMILNKIVFVEGCNATGHYHSLVFLWAGGTFL